MTCEKEKEELRKKKRKLEVSRQTTQEWETNEKQRNCIWRTSSKNYPSSYSRDPKEKQTTSGPEQRTRENLIYRRPKK